jgi:hypothetical protein
MAWNFLSDFEIHEPETSVLAPLPPTGLAGAIFPPLLLFCKLLDSV